MTQGAGPFSPYIFNVVVGAIIRELLCQVLGKVVTYEGYGKAVNLFLVIFHADDAFVAARDPEQLQA